MNNNISRHKKNLACTLMAVLACFFSGNNAVAQNDGAWEFRITPYLWMLSMEGETAVAGQNVPVEADFGDIFDNLNMALSLNFEANNGQYFFIIDPMYAELELDIEPNPTVSGTVEIDLVILDALAGVSVSDAFDLYGGLRYYDQDITVIPTMLPSIGLGDDWKDWVFGVRAKGPVSEKWSFVGRIDTSVGGDSDSMWWAQFMFSRHFGRNNQMHFDLGYRIYDVDYESGTGASRFLWDVQHDGPVVGYSWRF